MSCCKYNCAYVTVIAAILAGVALGILYTLGYVSAGIVFWAYLAAGVLGILLAPIYATGISCGGRCCFARYRCLVLSGAIGTVVTGVIGLLAAPFAATTAVAIILGIVTFFLVLLLGSLVCLTNCLSDN
ncbi:MAG: hypothetical protein IKC95_03665 [Oscillospiraceae bacterium]|nr:hypothetical protein [Oscillospiraceae bacterium]